MKIRRQFGGGVEQRFFAPMHLGGLHNPRLNPVRIPAASVVGLAGRRATKKDHWNGASARGLTAGVGRSAPALAGNGNRKSVAPLGGLANDGGMATSSMPAFVPKVGRPSKSQVAAIERAILATAREMFLESGYDAVAMEAVAAAAGVAKGTLYARYASKEKLFHAVVEDSVANWSQEAAAEDHLLTDDLRERLHHHARAIARSLVKPDVRAFNRLLAANAERFPVLARSMYDIGYLYIVELIARDIGAAARRDGIPVSDADGVARHLIGTISGWQAQESGRGEVSLDRLERFASRAVDLLMAARPIW